MDLRMEFMARPQQGQFRLGDQRYCYPLTLTDQYSRYIFG